MKQVAIATTGRMPGIDIARALAVFGMILVNYRLKMGVVEDGPQWLVFLAYRLDGRAAALFVVLAGLGISLRSRKARLNPAEHLSAERSALLYRAGILFVIGLLNLHIWPWDILHFYGLFLAFAAFFLNASNRVMGVLVGIILVVNVLLGVTFDYSIHLDFWSWDGAIRDLFFNGIHPFFPWMTFLIVGMWLGRLDLRDPTLRRRLVGWSLAVIAVAECIDLVAWYAPETVGLTDEVGAWLSSWPRPPGPNFILAGSASSIAVLGLCIEATQGHADRIGVQAMVATGQMAFTLYIAHAVAILVPLQHTWLDSLALPGSLLYGCAFYAVAVVFSYWWRRRHPYGPMEGFIRQISGRTGPAPWGAALAQPPREVQ